MTQIFHIAHFRAYDANKGVSQKGGLTIAYTYVNGGTDLMYAISRCNKTDNFIKSVGSSVAKVRLQSALDAYRKEVPIPDDVTEYIGFFSNVYLMAYLTKVMYEASGVKDAFIESAGCNQFAESIHVADAPCLLFSDVKKEVLKEVIFSFMQNNHGKV